jgi:SpoIIAA-like
MPYTYDIDRQANLVRVTITGHNTAAEMERRMREVTNDLRWSPGMDALVDLTGMTGLDMSADQIGDLTALHGMLDALIGDGRLAMVADKEVSMGFSRLYQTFGEQRTSMKIRVFQSVREAEQWLGINPRKDADRD